MEFHTRSKHRVMTQKSSSDSQAGEFLVLKEETSIKVLF